MTERCRASFVGTVGTRGHCENDCQVRPLTIFAVSLTNYILFFPHAIFHIGSGPTNRAAVGIGFKLTDRVGSNLHNICHIDT